MELQRAVPRTGSHAPADRRHGSPRRRAGRARTARSPPDVGAARTSSPARRGECSSATTRTWPSTSSQPPAARTTPRSPPTAPQAERSRRRSPPTAAGKRADREPESADRPARADQPAPTGTQRPADQVAGPIRRARRQGARPHLEHAEHAERLAALDPPTRRLGRVRDAHADERAFLLTAIEMDDRALSEVRADRTRLQRELGDPDQVRSERDGIENAIDQLQHDYDQVRDVLADRLLDRRPRWLIDALGDRPEHARESETWDRAARSVAAFRLDHDISDSRTALGSEPSLGDDASSRLGSSQRAARTRAAPTRSSTAGARARPRPRHRMRPRVAERPMRVPPFGHARRRSHLRPRGFASEAREGTRPTPRGPSGRRCPRCLSLDRDRLNQTVRGHLERCAAGTQARVLRSRAGAGSLRRLASPAASGSEILEPLPSAAHSTVSVPTPRYRLGIGGSLTASQFRPIR